LGEVSRPPPKFRRLTLSEPIPTKFWRSLNPYEFKSIILNDSKIEGELLLRLWRMWERQGPPPKSVSVSLELAAVEKLARTLKKRSKNA